MKRYFDWVKAENISRVWAHGLAALIFLLAALRSKDWVYSLEFGALSIIEVWLGWIQWKLHKRKSTR
jgi:hypothetical protein